MSLSQDLARYFSNTWREIPTRCTVPVRKRPTRDDNMQYKYLIGIDEAGRGPLAGPVAVGVVCVSPGFNWDSIPGVNDSKKLTPKKREEIFTLAKLLAERQALFFEVGMTSASQIDALGIVPAIRTAMEAALASLQGKCGLLPEECFVKLDGSLKAPEAFSFQETIIKGDAKEKVIGLASILAKVTRDQYMDSLSGHVSYSMYEFQRHKGYGTKAHRLSILQNGLSDMHRESFCRRLKKADTVV